jgi:hypothetical protein
MLNSNSPASRATFYASNLRIFLLSWSVCLWQPFQAWSNKHSSLVGKFVNYRCKKFYNIGPCGQYFKSFYVSNLVSNKLECLSP